MMAGTTVLTTGHVMGATFVVGTHGRCVQRGLVA